MHRKLDQTGLGAVELALIIVIVAIIGGTGYFVYHASTKSTDTINQTNLASQSTTPPQNIPADKKAITAAVKAYVPAGSATAAAAPDTVTVKTIVSSNAQGTYAFSDGSAGGQFVAHKAGGTWTVVYEGTQLPGKALGTQYNLPKTWYSTSY